MFIIIKRYIYVQRCKERTLSVEGVISFIKNYYIMDNDTLVGKRSDMWLSMKHFFDD